VKKVDEVVGQAQIEDIEGWQNTNEERESFILENAQNGNNNVDL